LLDDFYYLSGIKEWGASLPRKRRKELLHITQIMRVGWIGLRQDIQREITPQGRVLDEIPQALSLG
jgi:hypothetical protein